MDTSNELKRLMGEAREGGLAKPKEAEEITDAPGGDDLTIDGLDHHDSMATAHMILSAGLLTNMDAAMELNDDQVMNSVILNFGKEDHGLDAQYFNVNYGLSLVDDPSLLICRYAPQVAFFDELVYQLTKHETDPNGLVLRSHYGPIEVSPDERVEELAAFLTGFEGGKYRNVYLTNGEVVILNHGGNPELRDLIMADDNELTDDEFDRLEDLYYHINNSGYFAERELHMMFNVEDHMRSRLFNTKIILASLHARNHIIATLTENAPEE